MTSHDEEKAELEQAALDLFLTIYNANRDVPISVLHRQERPDFVLTDPDDNVLGLEVTHLFYDQLEAMTLLGRSNLSIHGYEVISESLDTLNRLLKQKEEKMRKYEADYPVSLLIRNSTRIFGMSDFLKYKETIYKPDGALHIWFLSRDGGNNEWLLKDLLTV